MKSMTRFLSAAAIICLLSAVAHAQSKGATLFQSNCQMCHGADGKGSTPTGQALKVANLTSPEIVKMSNAELASVITNGKKAMPGFGSRLTPPEIESLVSYIRTLQKQ
ncbi:MAG TPA: cytochrome c [Candidatus Angelobacter sp.]|jgi:mono/diheme cytochrome c family protein|nr:cytochrome c [Candidatus Angelobacter sp.]